MEERKCNSIYAAFLVRNTIQCIAYMLSVLYATASLSSVYLSVTRVDQSKVYENVRQYFYIRRV